MAMNGADSRVAEEVRGVLGCLKQERRLEAAVAGGKTDTGESLLRLEAACARAGIDRIDWRAALREEGKRLGLEALTEAAIENRKRMAKFRRRHPPTIAAACLALSPSRQRAIASLPAARMEEFVRRGVPTPDGRKPMRSAMEKEVRQAVRASREVPAGEPIPVERLRLPARTKPTESRQFDLAMAMLWQVGSLTLEQAERALLMLVTLFAMAPKAAQRTTRRLMESTIRLGSGLDGAVGIDQVLQTLDALPQVWQKVDFGPGTDRFEAANRACSMVARLVHTISLWTKSAERKAG